MARKPRKPPVDYSAEMRLSGSSWLRGLLMLAGHLLVGVAVVGAFVPLLPTTVFLLLAAACYVRASNRFYNWLLNTEMFGPLILNWRRHRAIAPVHKAVAITLIILTIGSSVVFFVPLLAVKLVLTLIGASVITFLVRVPSRVSAAD